MEEYRCNQTVDLEEYIMENKDKTIGIIKAEYRSGRVEEFRSELLKGGSLSRKEQSRLDDLRNFPSVAKVSIEYE